MAKAATDTDLFKRLRQSGVRKSAAKRITSAVDSGSKRSPKQVQAVTREMRALLAEVEDRAIGGGKKKKQKAAAKKAAATRKRNEAKRSASAKKAAATRKKNKARKK